MLAKLQQVWIASSKTVATSLMLIAGFMLEICRGDLFLHLQYFFYPHFFIQTLKNWIIVGHRHQTSVSFQKYQNLYLFKPLSVEFYLQNKACLYSIALYVFIWSNTWQYKLWSTYITRVPHYSSFVIDTFHTDQILSKCIWNNKQLWQTALQHSLITFLLTL